MVQTLKLLLYTKLLHDRISAVYVHVRTCTALKQKTKLKMHKTDFHEMIFNQSQDKASKIESTSAF